MYHEASLLSALYILVVSMLHGGPLWAMYKDMGCFDPGPLPGLDGPR